MVPVPPYSWATGFIPSIYIMSALGLVNQSASDLNSAAGLCSDVAHSTLDGADLLFYTSTYYIRVLSQCSSCSVCFDLTVASGPAQTAHLSHNVWHCAWVLLTVHKIRQLPREQASSELTVEKTQLVELFGRVPNTSLEPVSVGADLFLDFV